MTDTTQDYKSNKGYGSRIARYVDKAFETAAHAVVRGRLLRSNANEVIESVIRMETTAEARLIVPNVTKRIEDQIMDLSRDEIRRDVERRLGHQPLDVIIRNAIHDAVDPQIGPLMQRSVAEADQYIGDRVERAVTRRIDQQLAATVRRSIEEAIGPETLNAELKRAMDKVAAAVAETKKSKAVELHQPAKSGRTEHHVQFKHLLGMVRPIEGERGCHVMMVGPAGSGKSLIAEDIAEHLGLPFYFNGPLQSEYKLTGYKDANGTYHATPFRKAFEHGGVYLFDEIDACSAQALVAFNTALANSVCDFPDAQVRQHENFVCLAAANTYGQGATTQYAGRERIDGATLDRFGMVEISYDDKIEYALAQNDAWVTRVRRIRDIARESYPRLIVSMRASIQGAKLLKRGYDSNEVERMFIWRGQLTKPQIAEIQGRVGQN